MSKINESIVLVGGGGGVYRVGRFLKHIRPNITTVQTMFDHGRHSGQLRDERGVLPPGDLRQAIIALSDDKMESTLRKLMSYRFVEKGNSSLNNATVGNILLTALTEIEGSLPAAINALCRWCGVRGSVLPVSLDSAELCVKLDDDSILKGEGNIDNRPMSDDRVIIDTYLEPNAHIFVGAYDSIVNADKVVLCPGDLYTSLVPNLLVDGFVDALTRSKAKLIYVVNIMTKKAETNLYNVDDFARVVYEKILGHKIDIIIYNSDQSINGCVIEKYQKERSFPVKYCGKLETYCHKSFGVPLVDISGGIIRHHERIASVIADI